MKRLIPWMIGTAALLTAATLTFAADESLPGQVDFGTFSPPKGDGQFVEVNVPASLIAVAARVVEKNEPEVAKVLSGLKLVHVNVIGLDNQNRADLQKRAAKVRQDLSGKGWERVVTAKERGQDVSVYVKLDDKGAIQGLVAVVVDDSDSAVFANVVGDIKPEQLAMLGEKFQIDPLKKFAVPPHKSDDKSDEKSADKPKEKGDQ